MLTVTLPTPIELSAPPLCLRPWNETYAPALHRAVQESLENVGRWLPWCRAGYSLDDALAWTTFCTRGWQDGTHYAFAIFDADETLAGGVGLNQLDGRDHRANLGYWLRTSATGRGYATRAARAVAAFGFETLALRRIEIVAAIGNHSSQRCAENIGALREGVARQRVFLHGQSQDAVIYGLLPGDLT